MRFACNVHHDLGIKGQSPARSVFTFGVYNMRKIITVSFIAAAALAVTACGGSEPAATENTAAVTEMNAADAMAGTTNDAMTNVDGTMGADANMSADANAMSADANMAAPVDAAMNNSAEAK
jgi:hypothetical protein